MSMHKWYTYPGYLATIIFIAVLTRKFATNILSVYKMGLDDEEHLCIIDDDDDQWSDDSTDSEMVDQSDEDLVSLYIQVKKPIARLNKTQRELKRSAVRRLVEGRYAKLSQSPVAIKNNTDKLSSPWEKNDFFKAYCEFDDLSSGVDDDEDSADQDNYYVDFLSNND